MIIFPGHLTSAENICSVNYKFSTDVVDTENGNEVCYSKYSLPTREISTQIGSFTESSFQQLLQLLQAGATITVIPLWMNQTTLAANASAGDTEISLLDITDFAIDDYILLTRTLEPEYFDCHRITAIAGNTITLDYQLTYDHHIMGAPTLLAPFDVKSSYAVLCATGILNYEGLEFQGGRPVMGAKIKVDSGVWSGAPMPIEQPIFWEPPANSQYGPAHIVRDERGKENGVLQLRPIESTARLVFELEWNFYDTTWRLLRRIFLASKGKAGTFWMPTWRHEIRFLQSADLGATHIFLNEGYKYLLDRFPRIRVLPTIPGSFPFTLTLYQHISGTEFLCSPLEFEVLRGDYASLCPRVRFADDSITFDFSGPSHCVVKASFVEVLNWT